MPNNISIVWDFDGTLAPEDSTTKTVEILKGEGESGPFWSSVHLLRGDKDKKNPDWEHVLAMDAPIWMYSLSRLAETQGIPLNSEFFGKFVLPYIHLYDGVLNFLTEIKNLERTSEFKKLDLKIHHFVVSAGLKDLIQQVFPDGLVTWTFGCRYAVTINPDDSDDRPVSVPVYCMDETAKTRSLFEIVKGVFQDPHVNVNKRVKNDELWCPFENMIYIGDGPTDVPALSLTRDKGGVGIAVYNPVSPKDKIESRFKDMRLDKRADLITPADFSLSGELYQYIFSRCTQIRQRYEASSIVSAA
jgi:2-hydroxy-3-keto-5-methylthiopentenyl-1-phosphate phosphatase